MTDTAFTSTFAILARMEREAFENGIARSGDVTVRRFLQRKDRAHLRHLSPYRYQFYVKGKRVTRDVASRCIAA